jgi:hypothetical protein
MLFCMGVKRGVCHIKERTYVDVWGKGAEDNIRD